MWSLSHSCHPFLVREGMYERHPLFPKFETYMPLNYSLLAIACMSRDPAMRPDFIEITEVLQDLQRELGEGTYVDSLGKEQVRQCFFCSRNIDLVTPKIIYFHYLKKKIWTKVFKKHFI